MKVKICGIQTIEAALHATKEGADAIGFVFAPSKRKITPEKAKHIIQTLPEDIWKVGVFVDETPETIAEIVEFTGLTHIQLHGEEEPDLYWTHDRALIKSVSVRTIEDIQKIKNIQTVDYILLDSPPGLYKGGTGKSFDWDLASGLGVKDKIILAGGLNPQNVKKAIQAVQPIMVDVSSGVETNGEKDFEKISAFISEAKQTREDENK
ncbi:phosphoribosylanthranilate isomerase [Mesobacillus maritimus]|uniref:phosphoribosylanthranilate isomerase n=1 Tax=Mesobacillus maritimus TaxID=1643336 RepID=UPI00203F864E|nr:phosphoribosylanthranilate isomerase [Mesobacillus maritimus]MCM3588073.1 phosphoribosylanthranilate isomerase [Mesobacillus maritimus]MCM3668404.1 phosphoribosylanthranilate isomerase [Mesobacillus maritimus]